MKMTNANRLAKMPDGRSGPGLGQDAIPEDEEDEGARPDERKVEGRHNVEERIVVETEDCGGVDEVEELNQDACKGG